MNAPAKPADPTPTATNPLKDLWVSIRAMRGVGAMFWVCVIIYMLDGAAYFGILNVLTLFLGKSVNLSDRWSGAYVSAFTGVVTFMNLAFGFLVDRWGVRLTITLATLTGLLGRALLAASPSLPEPQVVAGMALMLAAFSAGTLQPAVYAGVKLATNDANRAMGFSLVYALMNGGSFVESMLSSEVRAAYGVGGVMWMCAGITAAFLALHVAAFPRDAGGRVEEAPRPAGAPVTSWRDHPLINARFFFFIFILLGVRTLFAHQWLTMPDYVTRAYPPEVGARFEQINALNPLIILFGAPLVAGVTRKYHVVSMMIAGTLVSASATFLLVPGPRLGALLAYVIIFSVGEALWSSRFLEYVASIAPADKVGVYMGVAQVPWFLAKTTTGWYSGWMLERFCPAEGVRDTGTLWLVYAFIGLISPIGLILGARWLRSGDMTKRAATA